MLEDDRKRRSSSGLFYQIFILFQGSGPAVCKVGRVLKHFRTSAVASDKFSRYPVPDSSALPEDLQATTRAYKEHAQVQNEHEHI